MTDMRNAKRLAVGFLDRLDLSQPGHPCIDVCTLAMSPNHLYRGVHPFNDVLEPSGFAETVWSPLRRAFDPLQRRLTLFLAGRHELRPESDLWVVCMGHLIGHFGVEWLGIEPTHKSAFIPFASFYRIEHDRIAETVEFLDLLSFLNQVGLNPFASIQTAAQIMSPGPQTQDGLLFAHQDPEASRTTLNLTQAMLNDLVEEMKSPPNHMARYWHSDMNWFGPAGIGACTGFEGYRRGHTGPFEERLEFLENYPGECSVAEGNFAAYFWRPGLKMRSLGGFLGLPELECSADMRVVDLYRRQDAKLAENWIFIDMLHFLKQQGVDLLSNLERTS